MAYFGRLMARFTLVISFVAALVVASAGDAHAHPILDEAARLFDEAEFEAALEVFHRAEEAGDLTRDDLIQLYEWRALVHHTLGNADDLETDLMRLASLDPDHQFGRQVPPVVREAFDRAKARTTGQITVHVDAEIQSNGVRLGARVQHDTSGIVQELRLGARAPGNAWTHRSNSALEMPGAPDTTLEVYAEAIGPGGAVVATDGTPDDPFSSLIVDLPGREAGSSGGGGVEIIPTHPPDDGGDGGVPVWPFLVGGGALVVGAVILIAVLVAGSGSSNTALMPPMVQP